MGEEEKVDPKPPTDPSSDSLERNHQAVLASSELLIAQMEALVARANAITEENRRLSEITRKALADRWL